MRMEKNNAGGETVILHDGDDLDSVPQSHRRLISPMIREVFAAPADHFRDIANRSRFANLSRWLNSLIAENTWELQLNLGPPHEGPDYKMAGFCWVSKRVVGATIALPEQRETTKLPNDLADFYALIETLNWLGFGYSGGLDRPDHHTAVSEFIHLYYNDGSIPCNAFVFGDSVSGNMLLYDLSGRGGWMDHDDGHFHPLGSIAETIEWVFEEMNNGRMPEYPYDLA